MVHREVDESTGSLAPAAAAVATLPQLSALLRMLRRRHARLSRDRELTYRVLADRTGWSVTSIAEYFTAKRLPPTDRLDALLVLLGADPVEQGALASARDRVDEHRRTGPSSLVDSNPQPAADAVVPRQLPPAARQFSGRRRELAELTEVADSPRGAGTVVITAIGGTAGVGKTTLALYWAHQMADRFPDGHFYVNLRGFDPYGRAVDPLTAARGFLDALGVAPARVPADADAQTALYRSVLADKRMLIVLDNARDAAHVRPLLPAAPGCLVVITSRNRLSSLVTAEGAYPVTLDLFTAAEAREALAARIGANRAAAEPEAVDTLVERAARLPLALAVVAARAGTHPERSLASVAQELADTRERLDAFGDPDPHTDLEAVFSSSYRALSPPAARLFRLLSLHPGPDLTAPAAAALAGVSRPEADALLAELTSASLTAERRPHRYDCHDLLRAYATKLAATVDAEADRRSATGRLFEHYLGTARAADRVLGPAQSSGYQQALDWFTAEHAVLLNVVDHAARADWPAPVEQLIQAVAVFLDRRGHWHDGLTIWRTAVSSADRRSDRAWQTRAHRQLGRAYLRLYRFDAGGDHLRTALELATRTGDRTEEAHINHMLAILCERRGDLDQAVPHDRRALDLYGTAGDRLGQAKVLNALGWHLSLLGHHDQALIYCDRALALLRRLDVRAEQAHTLDSLGNVHHHLGHAEVATSCYQRALDLHREVGDRFGEAEVLDHIGDMHRDRGDAAEARRSWWRALDVLTELAHPSADQVRAKLTPTG